MEGIHRDFPEADKSAVWYGHKLEEEVREFQDARTWDEQVRELSDVFITLVSAFLDLGVAPQIALLYTQEKIAKVRERFASGWYKENPQLKIPEVDIYTPPFFDNSLE